jgi:hypothetical protein
VSLYPVPSRAASVSGDAGEVPGGGALMVAVRLSDLVSPALGGAQRQKLEQSGHRAAVCLRLTGTGSHEVAR